MDADAYKGCYKIGCVLLIMMAVGFIGIGALGFWLLWG